MQPSNDANINIIISNILSQKRYSHCRLCLCNIEEVYVCTSDAVTLNPSGGVFQSLKSILVRLLGEELNDDIPGVDAVCVQCVENTLAAMRFLDRCRTSMDTLSKAFESISNAFENNFSIESSDKVIINITESKTDLLAMKKPRYNRKQKCKQPFECTDCLLYFNGFDDLKVHNLAHHGYVTSSIIKHRKPNNPDNQKHQLTKCPECPLFCDYEESLKVHYDRQHATHICQECGKYCIGLDKLIIHEEKHKTKKSCPKCSKTYSTKDFYDRHVKLCLNNLIDPHPIRNSMVKSYRCEKCDKAYGTRGGLRVHNRFAHGNAKPHVCPECGKKFPAPSCLRTHMIKHTGEKNFKCDICGSRFVSKEALLYHTRRHTGEKPYNCTICEERFVNASARAEHIKFKHLTSSKAEFQKCHINKPLCRRKFNEIQINTMDHVQNIILKGENVGERHCYLNSLVNRACKEEIDFQKLSEGTPIDKIYKIDVANRFKNVEYILYTLKDDDMLYVSRALKSLWLLDSSYRHIVNPIYLENKVFPEMTRPAVNKMKHWIELNLKDQERCEEFYLYNKTNFKDSIKYLRHCSPAFIVKEIVHVFHKLTPHHLKILCEACPGVVQVYFECIKTNHEALCKYFDEEYKFFDSFKCLLKLDGELYLDLLESCLSPRTLSPAATIYIMKKYKGRFQAKRELYTSQILNIKTLASCLSPNECKDLVLLLAKAEYLEGWFSYQRIEPLIKRIASEERATFKKLIFVNKEIGERVKEWPYEQPSPPKVVDRDDHIFFDADEHYDTSEFCEDYVSGKCMLMKRKYAAYACNIMESCKPKTLLDQLFDRYRFSGFSKTFSELKNRLQVESSIEGRQNIFLVLVSKTGGVPEHVKVLMKLLVEQHKNEPSNLRAAVVRSFVKRVCFWRMPEDIWTLMLEFAYTLGLDGLEGQPLCVEGLHAVILRSIINGTKPTSELMNAYRKNFTTFKEYNLSGSEVKLVKMNLTSMLIDYPNEFLDVVSTYNVKIQDVVGAVDALAKAAHGNKDLISRLFESRVARRQLIAETFPIKQFEASYINSLRHDVSLLSAGEIFTTLASKEKTNHDRFLRYLKIYFGEANGLADQHLVSLENEFKDNPKMSLVRPLALLASSDTILKIIQCLTNEKTKQNLKLIQAFKDNIHATRPHIRKDTFDWRLFGPKAVANQLLICRIVSLEQNIKKCLERRATHAIALRLALNTSFEVDTFKIVAIKSPKVTINVATSYFFKDLGTINPEIWNLLKEIILKFHYQNLPRKSLQRLSNQNNIPKNIRADFWTTVYAALSQVNQNKAMRALYKLESSLPNVDKGLLKKIIKDFIENKFTAENVKKHSFYDDEEPTPDPENIMSTASMKLYFRLIAKFLLLTTSEEEQRDKVNSIMIPLFDKLEALWKEVVDKSCLKKILQDFLISFKYTLVFTSNQYVSCMPVFEMLISRLQKVMTRIENFNIYVKIHLTILYYKAIRHTLKLKPNIFEDDDKTEAMNEVGAKFGEYIGSDIKELVREFFPSVIEIYKNGLKSFFEDYFPYKNCQYTFILTVAKGILKNDTLEAQMLAEYMYEQYKMMWGDSGDILNILRESRYQEVRFFLNADVFASSPFSPR
ncbi:unnamed protein product [Leptosia nina]|uniref:Uncharacterized protein n=1 Tax=Leptosia nina TaxID=320188 RepID=A0AAV1JI56_9NEOP